MSKGSGTRKPGVSIRLTDEAMRLVAELCKQKGVSRTAVIEMAVRAFAKQEGVP